ncbi:hypothetical protein BKA65DRAFT_576347 [Rhexocercosporidium sp. MPI-PUGE-AT-0058]|nr:hypothetical protein BKA65DRAFT_576347 [Rhexocercosporidium sp. MPI-PUGE-AT-0058]
MTRAPPNHLACPLQPLSATNAACLRKQYPNARPLSNNTRQTIVEQLIQGVVEQSLTTVFSNLTTDPSAGGNFADPRSAASSTPNVTFQSNVMETGGLDFGAGGSVVDGHGLAGITIPETGIQSPDVGTGSGQSYGGDGGGGGGSRVGYRGGDGGGGGAGFLGF